MSATAPQQQRQQPEMDAEIVHTYKMLVGIRDKLKLFVGHEHSTEDLRHYQNQLDAIDNKRQDGIFCGSVKSGHIPHGQAACALVLDECYDIVAQLTDSAGPISAVLEPEYVTLQSIRRRLEEIKRIGNPDEANERIRRYQGMLDQIDRNRKNGVFAGTDAYGNKQLAGEAVKRGMIPSGQAILSDMLAECYELVDQINSKLEGSGAQRPRAGGGAADEQLQKLRLDQQQQQQPQTAGA